MSAAENVALALPGLGVVEDLAKRGVTVALGANGFDLRTDPPSLRVPRAAFELLVEQQHAVREALREQPARSCARRECGQTFHALGATRFCSRGCRRPWGTR